MPDNGFPVKVIGGVPVLAAPEEIDITNAEALRSALLTAAPSGPGTLVVDMTRTQFCDSSGLHALLAAHKRAQAEGGEVLLVIPSIAVLRVFAITCVDRIIPNFTSLAEALAQPAATANSRSRQRDEGDAALAGDRPGPLKRSSEQARKTLTSPLASAVQLHQEGDPAFRAAYAELRRTFKKTGGHWIPKQAPAPAGKPPQLARVVPCVLLVWQAYLRR